MQQNVNSPSVSEGTAEAQKQFLKSLGLESDKSIHSCDPQKETVTFEIDGHLVTRQHTQTWTRVMGYHRPTTSFNKGKQSEHRERRFFTETSTLRTPA